MAALEEIQPGMLLSGLIPGEIVTVVAAARAGESSIRLTFRLASGVVDEQIVYRFQEAELGVAAPEMGRPFNADGELFRSVAEARRIQLAYLFDHRLAVHLSQIQPLPGAVRTQDREVAPPTGMPALRRPRHEGRKSPRGAGMSAVP
jgi:hypothetical protein